MLKISINTSYKNEAKRQKKKKVYTNITDVYICKGSIKKITRSNPSIYKKEHNTSEVCLKDIRLVQSSKT